MRLDLLELFGSGYVIDHCVAAINAEQQEECYRVYVTDMLANIYNGLGGSCKTRYYNILHPAPVDTRSAEEIVAENNKRMGLKVVKRK